MKRTVEGRDTATGEVVRVSMEDGRIAAIAPGTSQDVPWLAPGLIDLQINGYRGFDLNTDSVDPDTVIALTREVLATGVTTYLPTITTASEESIIRSLRAIARARELDPLVAHAIPFVHVEGPFISREDGARGAHARDDVREADFAEVERWQAASGDLVGLLTVSPHDDAALGLISRAVEKGIEISIGHTDADPARIRLAANAGARLSTHLGNGVRSTLPRHPNLLWAQLAEDRLTAMFIADGHHLPDDTLKVMLRSKTPSKSILVSDAVALAAMPAGRYETSIGGNVEVTTDGAIISIDSTTEEHLGDRSKRLLAGAYRPLIEGVSQVVRTAEISLCDAVRMATERPGRFVGNRGLLRVGETADIVLFDAKEDSKDFKVERVFSMGSEIENSPT